MFMCYVAVWPVYPLAAQQEDRSGSIGIEATISSAPPTTAATISSPSSGSAFTTLPIQVTGICQADLLVKIFRNNVFSGSAPCTNGSYSVFIDLFDGQNDIVAYVYDELDQEGPPSNTVTVTYQSPSGGGALQRVSLSSNFARRGANPDEELVWPVIVTGGTGPYAISVDWGDGQSSLASVQTPGEFNIRHSYSSSGVYTIIVKATDSEGATAYLQLVGVANGALASQTSASSDDGLSTTSPVSNNVTWQLFTIVLPLMISTFWLGRRYELRRIRNKIEAGELPFNAG